MPVSPGASGMQPRDPCRPWRGTLASGHKPRRGLLALQSLESNAQLSFATRVEDWTCLGQHKRHPEFPVVTRESRRNSRKTTWLPRHRKMKPFPATAPQEKSHGAHHLARGFDELHELKMRVGALPAFPTNALKYNLTWSVDGLINEYCHPCEAIHDGRRIEALPLEGLEHFSLDGVEYEAFNTSGGLGTLCETLAGRVRTLDYKSVRYPGHRALMKMLLDDLGLARDQGTLVAILRRAVPATMQDVVLVFVTASGVRDGVLMQEVFARKIFADRDREVPMSAIQITTAAGICAAVDLFREGRLPRRGFIRQEQVELPAFLANRFGRAYQQLRQVESIA